MEEKILAQRRTSFEIAPAVIDASAPSTGSSKLMAIREGLISQKDDSGLHTSPFYEDEEKARIAEAQVQCEILVSYPECHG